MSKKQRSKAEKAAKNGSNKQTTTTKQLTSKWTGPFNFFGLPREVRDKIYALLLVKTVDEDEWKRNNATKSGDYDGDAQQMDRRADLYEQELAINLEDADARNAVKPGLGLLKVNKQMYKEASKCLFSKNTFTIVITGEGCPTICGVGRVRHPDSFEVISLANFSRIKHMIVLIQNTRSLDDPLLPQTAQHSEECLATIVMLLLGRRVNLKTLRVRYASCFSGDIDYAREVLDFPKTGEPRPAFIFDSTANKPCAFKWDEDLHELFEHTYILGPLKKLHGHVDDIRIHGDLRTNYIYEITEAVEGDKPTARAVVRKKQETTAEAKRKSKHPASSAAEFVHQMAAKEPYDQGLADWDKQFQRSPYYSPRVIQNTMDPSTFQADWEAMMQAQRAG